MNLPDGTIKAVQIITNKNTGKWCQIPYPNHPKGCPKYNKDNACPPIAPFIAEILDLRKSIYIVFSEFNLHAHVEKMRKRHSQWSERQLRNVLYWQGTSRKQLRQRTLKAMSQTNCNVISYCPEGMGVNVYATCRASGLKLQRIRDLMICRHIALIGYRRK